MHVNLARKWRSKIFDTIIGQEIPVRILKNSLYVQHYFPVYLFAGMRGCGKTTTARVFAAAINCHAREGFYQNPAQFTLPCLTCASCTAMNEGRHPDFIEIDAASHTGVDNVRAIIEAASFLPILGTKKIYLIDEAHMLSKAAFNAFLKILEEPPANALFMLATTEPHKIIDTVRSRCFQLFFSTVSVEILKKHLAYVCTHEQIVFEERGLELIIQETEGCVRDALNLLEQVRFTAPTITYDAVASILGYINDEAVLALLELISTGNRKKVIAYCAQFPNDIRTMSLIWKKLVELVRSLLLQCEGVSIDKNILYHERIKKLACSLNRTIALQFLELLYQYEPLFLKTTMPQTCLELVLIKLTLCISVSVPEQADDLSSVPACSMPDPVEKTTAVSLPADIAWQKFVTAIDTLQDPLVASIFKQARFIYFDPVTYRVDVSFPQQLVFFKEWLDSTQKLWQPLLNTCFGGTSIFNAQFQEKRTSSFESPIQTSHNISQKLPQEKSTPFQATIPRKSVLSANSSRDYPELRSGKNAQLLLRFFNGTFTLLKEHAHE